MRDRKHPIIVVAGLVVALAVATGCSAPQQSPSSGQGASDSGPVKPKVDRVIIAMTPFRGEGNDPGRDLSAPLAVQLRPMYDKLIGIDAKNGKLIPELATEWKLEPDGKSFRFILRKGVQFHDNAGEFTGKDIQMTFDDMTQQGSLSSNGPIFKDTVEEIQQVNPYEVVMKQRVPDAEFLNNVSQLVGGFEIVSKADYDKRGYPTMTTRPLAGTGPYQFKERAQGQYIRFERPPFQHYRVTPDFPELEMRMVGEASTRMAALLTGEVHMAPLPEDLLAQAERQNMKVAKGAVPSLRIFIQMRGVYLNDPKDFTGAKGFKFPNSPFMKPQVRQALSKATDRDALNKGFFNGKGELMVLNPYHPTRLGWNPEWEKQFPQAYGFDVEKARSLLTEAGYGPSNPLKLEFLLSKLPDVSASEDIAEAVASMWKKVGVDASLTTIDSTQLDLKRRQLEFDHHLEVWATASHQLTGVRVYGTSLHGIRGQAVELPEVSGLYQKASEILNDDEKVAPIWKQLGDKSFAGFQTIPLFWLDTKLAVNPQFVSDYIFPASISGSWTHLENIKAAR